MIIRRPEKQLRLARSMRHAMTKAEELLWRSLRSRRIEYKFRRQVPVGLYIADFACLDAKLIVELDGPPHDKAEQQARDQIRDAWLKARGWMVLRVPNEIVFGGGDLVLDAIKRRLPQVPSSDPTSSGHLLPQAGEGRAAQAVESRSCL